MPERLTPTLPPGGIAPRPSESFGREKRIRKSADFARIQREGARVTAPHYVFLLSRQPAEQEGPARLGLVVSRKVGGAVVRNRVKRLARECFRRWPEPWPAGIDIVVIARAGAGDLTLEAVRSQWAGAFRPLLRKAQGLLATARGDGHSSATSSPGASPAGAPRRGGPPRRP